MKYVIDEDVVKNSGLNLPEFLAILIVKTGVNISELFKSIVDKELVVKDIFNTYLVTQRWDEVTQEILLDSEKTKPKETKSAYEDLALELMKIFDKGRKINRDGTLSPYYFKCNKTEVIRKLKKFFKVYGNNYTNEQIIQAANNYVSSFNGVYTYMRLLKYFIYKDDRKINADGEGYVEEVSELATYLDNLESNTNTNNDWTSTLK